MGEQRDDYWGSCGVVRNWEVGSWCLGEDGIIIITAKGIVIRTSLKDIRVMGRATQGVRIVRL